MRPDSRRVLTGIRPQAQLKRSGATAPKVSFFYCEDPYKPTETNKF
jgi:hypothetical protein